MSIKNIGKVIPAHQIQRMFKTFPDRQLPTKPAPVCFPDRHEEYTQFPLSRPDNHNGIFSDHNPKRRRVLNNILRHQKQGIQISPQPAKRAKPTARKEI